MKRYSNHVRKVLFVFITLAAFLLVNAFSQVAGLHAEKSVNNENRQTAVAVQPDVDNSIAKLYEATGESVAISRHKSTGVVSFIRFQPGSINYNTSGERSVGAAREASRFLETHGAVFGINDFNEELLLVSAESDNIGGQHVSYQQIYQDTAVFAGILKVHFNAAGQLIAANGTFVPNIKIATTPTLSAAEAEEIAINTVGQQQAATPIREVKGLGEAKGLVSYNLSATNTTVWVYHTGLLQGVSGSNVLVYEIEVGNGRDIREFVYVDAHNGHIVNQITGIHNALDRKISESNLANVVWQESNSDPDPIPSGWAGGSAQQVTDWNNEIDGAKETYNLFASAFGRDSYDGAGATLHTVNNDPGINCPNANWNGTSTNYCSGVTGDDTVAHEWGHAYTQETNNLIYKWQSGALNESYSDIWGEVVDFQNGRGSDVPGTNRTAGSCSTLGAGAPANDNSYRWLSGEDDPAFGGAIRDLWNPTCYGDPGKVSDTQYFCGASDGGGVHHNSGVPNHAFALMVDGGTYNSQTITGLGLTKAAHIHWGAQLMLTPASNFVDQADALEASCTSLIGINLNGLDTSSAGSTPSGAIISASDCQEVVKINNAVQFRTAPSQCGYEPLLDANAPALCEGGPVNAIWGEDFSSGLGDWTLSNNFPTGTALDWTAVTPTDSWDGLAAFAIDPAFGSCGGPDDQSGVMSMESPTINIPAGAAVPSLAWQNWVANETTWDGGNVKISINGSPFTLIPASAFTFNAYPGTLSTVGGGNSNPLAGEPAFTGTDGGQNTGSWAQSQVNLLALGVTAGDTIKLRFDMGMDGCTGIVGWYVDDIQAYSCETVLSCGNSILDPGESCDDGNSASGDGCSSICQVEDGWSCTEPIPPSTGNVVNDHSFEAGTPNPTWAETSTNFGTPLCTISTCGGPGGSDGDWFAWFGGIGSYEAGSLEQSVTIPASGTELEFDLLVGICDSPADYMSVLVDGNVVYSTNPCTAGSNYSTKTVDISAYADGSPHTLRFESEIFATNGGGSNFFLDNVVIAAEGTPPQPSVCIEFTATEKIYLPIVLTP